MRVRLPSQLTPKGTRTRKRLLDAALTLFVEKGYTETTMQDIAAATNTSLGLTYRYFASKDEMVLAFYQRLANTLAQDMAALPSAPVADRFVQLLEQIIGYLQPYHKILGVLFSVSPVAPSGIAILSDRTVAIRQQVGALFLDLVRGATDAPQGSTAEDLATLLYVGHLLVILFWLHDRSPEMRSTHELLQLARTLLMVARRFLRLPPIARILARFAQIFRPVFLSDKK